MRRHSAQFRQCLEDCDVETLQAIWTAEFPGLPQPTRAEAEISLHMARTQSASISFKKRAYSHAWLHERNLPSQLPDHLRPRAERVYPVIVDCVGIAIKTPPHRRELGNAITQAMSDVVEDHYSRGIRKPEIIKPRMLEAREKIRRI